MTLLAARLLACLLLAPGQAPGPCVGVAHPQPPSPPPGPNVHLVAVEEGRRFWRGGAPRRGTLEALAAAARERGVRATLVDLRHPPTADDRSGKDGRLSPDQEATAARALGLDYLSISALDRGLIEALDRRIQDGDVYLHCMYGVNRTGFAVGRWAFAGGRQVSRTKLGTRDWEQGVRFQKRLQSPKTAR